MNFISRVVGAHRLLLLPFYSHLQRYVASQQREVTHILAYMVQACHDLVPPDEVRDDKTRHDMTNDKWHGVLTLGDPICAPPRHF